MGCACAFGSRRPDPHLKAFKSQGGPDASWQRETRDAGSTEPAFPLCPGFPAAPEPALLALRARSLQTGSDERAFLCVTKLLRTTRSGLQTAICFLHLSLRLCPQLNKNTHVLRGAAERRERELAWEAEPPASSRRRLPLASPRTAPRGRREGPWPGSRLPALLCLRLPSLATLPALPWFSGNPRPGVGCSPRVGPGHAAPVGCAEPWPVPAQPLRAAHLL